MIDPLREPGRIAFAGDWHGNTSWACAMINNIGGSDAADVIVHVGDFGYKFAPAYLDSLQEALSRYDLPLLFIDGNHDHQRTLTKLRIRADGLRRLRGHIYWMPRGFRWQWHGKTYLALGGAYSVDRAYRSQLGPDNWWPSETITDSQMALAMNGGVADVLVSHDCPSGVPIPYLSETSKFFPADAIAEAELHRERLRKVIDVVQPKRIIHGHYHRYYEQVVDLGYGPVHVIGLDCDGGGGNIRILNAALLRV